MVVKTATYVPFEGFQDKQFSKNCKMLQPPSDFEMEKVGPLVEKNYSGFFNRISRFQGNFLRKNDFSFEKVLIFLVSFWEIDQFPCRFANFFSQVCQNTSLSAWRKETGRN